MADTHKLKTHVEPFVRKWLEKKYSQQFSREYLPLVGGEGFHEFDGVSADRQIVAGIKSSSGRTSGGKNPSGKLASVYQELYFLSNVGTATRLLVLTDGEFFEFVCRKTWDKLAGGDNATSLSAADRIGTAGEEHSSRCERGN